MRSKILQRDYHPTQFLELYQEMLELMQQHLERIKQRDLLVFWGLSGVGKSTSINFFLGHPLIKITDGVNVRYRLAETAERNAAIGHEVTSLTTFPELFDVPSTVTSFLDMPGLNDTRSKNISLCTALLLKHLSTKARIKGIVVVLRYTAITDPRAQGMRDLFKLISQLTHDLQSKNILFCITGLDAVEEKNTQKLKKYLLAEAKRNAQHMQSEIQADEKNDVKQELTQTIDALSLMNEQNLFLMVQLDDPTYSAALKRDFFHFTHRTSYLTTALNPVIDQVTYLELLRQCKDIATQANAYLKAFQETKTVDKQQALHKHITETIQQYQSAQQALTLECEPVNQLIEEEETLKEALQALQSTQHQKSQKRFNLDIAFPDHPHVSGLYSKQFDLQLDPYFEHIQCPSCVSVIDQKPSEGKLSLRVNLTAHQKSNDVELELCYQQKHTAEYHQQLNAIKSKLQHIATQKNKLQENYQRLDQQLVHLEKQLKHCCLKTDIAVDQDIDKIIQDLRLYLSFMEKHIDELRTAQGEALKNIDDHEKEYHAVAQIASLTQLGLHDADIKHFLEAFARYIEGKEGSTKTTSSPSFFKDYLAQPVTSATATPMSAGFLTV